MYFVNKLQIFYAYIRNFKNALNTPSMQEYIKDSKYNINSYGKRRISFSLSLLFAFWFVFTMVAIRNCS